MKALSIKQPYATFIIDEQKYKEHRTWNTSFRGPVLIHASKIPDKFFMEEYGFADWKFPTGVILGKAELYDVVDYENGIYAYVLENIVKFKKPIPMKGQLGFFEVPKDIMDKLPIKY